MKYREKETEIAVTRDIRSRAINLYFAQALENAAGAHVGKFIFEAPKEEDPPSNYNTFGNTSPPSLALSYDKAQELMDGLWNENIRPSKRLDSSGQVEAMQLHINSLQGEIDFLRSMLKHHAGIIT